LHALLAARIGKYPVPTPLRGTRRRRIGEVPIGPFLRGSSRCKEIVIAADEVEEFSTTNETTGPAPAGSNPFHGLPRPEV